MITSLKVGDKVIRKFDTRGPIWKTYCDKFGTSHDQAVTIEKISNMSVRTKIQLKEIPGSTRNIEYFEKYKKPQEVKEI